MLLLPLVMLLLMLVLMLVLVLGLLVLLPMLMILLVLHLDGLSVRRNLETRILRIPLATPILAPRRHGRPRVLG